MNEDDVPKFTLKTDLPKGGIFKYKNRTSDGQVFINMKIATAGFSPNMTGKYSVNINLDDNKD